MVDKNGTPLMVSGVLVYYVKDSYKALVEVQNYSSFISQQAQSTLKMVVSKYSYESEDKNNDGKADDLSLKAEGAEIARMLVDTLDSKVSFAGLKVVSFAFDELSYAPEIASGMLRRQQAGALVAARSTIVEGAVDTALDAIKQLNEKGGMTLSKETQEKIMVNLLTVMVAENDAQPTVRVG
jgi:membrane protease subunit (stomatin/prohibitin family)